MMVSHGPPFRDRKDAGRQLAQALIGRAPENPLVLGLPRGGVPVAYEVACELDAELDILFVRKLGAPGYEELGIGAVIDGADPQVVLNDEIIRQIAPNPAYVEAETRRQLREIERRRQLYLGDRQPASIGERNVILVDDGIATGGTVRAALKGLRKAHARKVLLAVPVAPPDVVQSLAAECDGIVCLASPDPFYAVGAHYMNFDQTGDAEVTHLLADAALHAAASRPGASTE